MYLKITLFTFFLFLIPVAFFAQNVTTLINDSSRDFEAIHWHEDGRIFSVDYNNGRLYQIYLDGTVETLVTGISNLAGGGFGADGSFYFSSLGTNQIYRLNSDATTTSIASGLNFPTGILQSNSTDTLYVAQYGNNSVAKVSISSGEKTNWASANGINGPDGVIDDGNGNILIANYDDNKIHIADMNGNVSLFATLPSFGLMGYITKFGENIYVPSIAGNKIYKVTMDGLAEVLAGSGAPGNLDGESEMATFNDPNGIVINPTGDTLLITDGRRIRMITNLEGTSKSNDLNEISDLKITPNPANELIILIFKTKEALELEWRIFNQQGQTILHDNFQNYLVGENKIQVSINHLSVGVYSIQLINEKGEMKTMQFVKSE
ncbi:MAG: SMP-30/gluconolactonase/LRE family protein [Saprospiraceae bacterium]